VDESMTERIKMTVTMDVTIPQALALQAFFEYWNELSKKGSSRFVAFYVDGDGNFKPNAEVSFSDPVPELTDELRKLALFRPNHFDFDAISWQLAQQGICGKYIKINEVIKNERT
jgi:hypothetical protein